jgi:hypothetical protein
MEYFRHLKATSFRPASLKMREADALYTSLALLNDRTDEGRDRSPPATGPTF